MAAKRLQEFPFTNNPTDTSAILLERIQENLKTPAKAGGGWGFPASGIENVVKMFEYSSGVGFFNKVTGMMTYDATGKAPKEAILNGFAVLDKFTTYDYVTLVLDVIKKYGQSFTQYKNMEQDEIDAFWWVTQKKTGITRTVAGMAIVDFAMEAIGISMKHQLWKGMYDAPTKTLSEVAFSDEITDDPRYRKGGDGYGVTVGTPDDGLNIPESFETSGNWDTGSGVDSIAHYADRYFGRGNDDFRPVLVKLFGGGGRAAARKAPIESCNDDDTKCKEEYQLAKAAYERAGTVNGLTVLIFARQILGWWGFIEYDRDNHFTNNLQYKDESGFYKQITPEQAAAPDAPATTKPMNHYHNLRAGSYAQQIFGIPT